MTALSNFATRLLSVIALSGAVAACSVKQESPPPATVFNQKLTDMARQVSRLPVDVEQVKCWAAKPLFAPDRVFCNVFLMGRASQEIGQTAIGWDIPVREASRLDGLSGEEPRYLIAHRFDLSLLASTGFLLVAKNSSQGLSIEVAVNQDRVSLDEVSRFIDTVLPVVSREISSQLANAHRTAPDAIRATWSSK